MGYFGVLCLYAVTLLAVNIVLLTPDTHSPCGCRWSCTLFRKLCNIAHWFIDEMWPQISNMFRYVFSAAGQHLQCCYHLPLCDNSRFGSVWSVAKTETNDKIQKYIQLVIYQNQFGHIMIGFKHDVTEQRVIYAVTAAALQENSGSPFPIHFEFHGSFGMQNISSQQRTYWPVICFCHKEGSVPCGKFCASQLIGLKLIEETLSGIAVSFTTFRQLRFRNVHVQI